MQSKEEIFSIKSKLKKILKDRVFVFFAVAGIILNIALFVFLKIFINFDQTTFILHYNVYFGIDKISFNFNENPLDLILIPIGSLLIWFINFIISFFLYLTSLREQLQCVETKNCEKAVKSAEDDSEKRIYPKVFGAYVLMVGSILISLVVGIYILSVILVNS